MSRFPIAFRLAGVRFLDILFPLGTSALLAVGLPSPLIAATDPDGVSTFRTCEMQPGSGAL
ncbi:hypothetical protein GCM10022267_76820 [Lentzea roselyniae]|uniref:Uncharacterized protein n=1 Tax=Lentzea roselyniae TaxID=531940 RepID=A0ABP7C774_9PSEU